jgi:CxxC motif-containing protein (DUF1111 family)
MPMKSTILLSRSLAIILVLGAVLTVYGQAQSTLKQSRLERFTPRKGAANEGPAGYFYIEGITKAVDVKVDVPGRTGFDNLTNGFAKQGPPFDTLNEDNVVPLRSYNDDRFIFEATERFEDGLGPTYNAQSCVACHENVVTGGASQVTEHRTGHTSGNQFFEAPGGSLVQSRATNPEIVEPVLDEDETRTFRISTNVMGDGYVECIADSTLKAISHAQPEDMRGTPLLVAVLEGDGSSRVGRFGWKCQHGSLLSFAADAYVNEIGITSPLLPDENTSGGVFVGFGSGYDPLPDPESDGVDIASFANFMRSTKAPARGTINADVKVGERLFNNIGCAICHVSTITTTSAGTVIDGGTFTVPKALANKTIHPMSDFLLHDIGTGDGIPYLPLPEYQYTAKLIRTAPLWGLRTRNRLMHDGLSFTRMEAIQRHTMQAQTVTDSFNALTATQQAQIMTFLNSL